MISVFYSIWVWSLRGQNMLVCKYGVKCTWKKENNVSFGWNYCSWWFKCSCCSSQTVIIISLSSAPPIISPILHSEPAFDHETISTMFYHCQQWGLTMNCWSQPHSPHQMLWKQTFCLGAIYCFYFMFLCAVLQEILWQFLQILRLSNCNLVCYRADLPEALCTSWVLGCHREGYHFHDFGTWNGIEFFTILLQKLIDFYRFWYREWYPFPWFCFKDQIP